MDTKKSRDKHWGPLFQLIANWVYTSVPELTLNDPEQRRLLFIQDNKRSEFIRPTAISTLLDITTNAGVDSRTTALFLWASAEAAAWRNYKPAQFDVDYIISNSVDQEHVAEYCFKVTKLFSEPVTLTADHVDLEEDTHLAGEEESNHGMLASDETQEGGAESVDLVGHDAGDEKDSEFITQLPTGWPMSTALGKRICR